MRRVRNSELAARLRELRAPDEAGAEERSWEVVRASYAERTPLTRAPATRRLAAALGAGALIAAVALSPAGAKVGDLVSEVTGIGEEDARPALRSLPAGGELLVETEDGIWIVRDDGSKRLLGTYDEASWSPNGFFVIASDDRQLVALDPSGGVRWSLTAPRRVGDPRWGGTEVDTRIAYRSGGDLWVVAGDGDGQRLIARDVSPVAAAWRPPAPESKLGLPVQHALTYMTADAAVRTVDADTGARVETTGADRERLSTPTGGHGEAVGPTTSPDGTSLAAIATAQDGTRLMVSDDSGRHRTLFSTRGRLTGPTWSPDGRWLLVGWPAADQWLFIDVDRPRHVIAIDNISEQFNPGGDGAASFPRPTTWILPER